MVLTESTLMARGTRAPDFNLVDVISSELKSLQSLQSSLGTVVMFICNHCPYVVHIIDHVVLLAREYTEKGFQFVAISSNDVQHYPQDGPEPMAVFARERGFVFPYLYDESQAVAKAYNAQCTPEFYVFDHALEAVYHGRFDASSPGKDAAVTGEDLKTILEAMVNQTPIPELQFPSMGCNIKWR